jgi:hypothetical protein
MSGAQRTTSSTFYVGLGTAQSEAVRGLGHAHIVAGTVLRYYLRLYVTHANEATTTASVKK